MDYEKKYKGALERAREWYNKTEPDSYTCIVESIFPELKESEDEKIRRAIIEFFELQDENTTYSFVKRNDILAWLEKQGKKKSTDNLNQQEAMDIAVAKCFDEQEVVDKIEPKFNEGDLVVLSTSDEEKIVQIDSIEYFKRGEPKYITSEGRWFGNGTKAHLWTIQDAKDGDILAINNEVFIYAHRKQMYSIAVAYCFVDSVGGFYLDGEFGYTEKGNSIHPATKEQRELLFQKMHKAGYEWSAEMKELMKIEDVCMYSMDNYADEERKILCKGCNISCKYNSADWSEEDKRIMSAILQLLKDCESENDWNCVYSNDREVFFADIEKWLKSLKDRFSIHQNNLSEDDEINYRILQAIICNSDTSSTLANRLSDWLESLKNRIVPQPKEWSEEDEEKAAKLKEFITQCKGFNKANREKAFNMIDALKPKSHWKPSKEQIVALRWVLNNIPYNKHKEEISGLLDQIKDL